LAEGQRVKVVCVLSICTLVLSLATAAFGLDPDRDIHQLAHRSWGEKEGYPGRTEALAQTADGFLWLGTDSGLFRFDGVRFERYVPRSGDTLPAGPLHALLALPDGSLWIAFRLENTISVLRNGRVKNYGKADGVTSYPTAIVQDHEGTLWASIETGVIRFNGTRWDQIGADWNFPEAVPQNTSEALLVDSQGTLWAGVNHTILCLDRGSRRFTETGISVGWSASIAEAPDGTIWHSDTMNHVRAIGSSLSRKDGAIPNCEPSVPNRTPGTCGNAPLPVIRISNPVRLLFDRRGSLWMTTDTSGVSRIPNPELLTHRAPLEVNDAVQSFTAKDGLSADNCDPVLEDREGNIWVATRDGLDQFRDSALLPIVLPTSLYRSSIAPADDGGIWVTGSYVYLAHVYPNAPKISVTPTHAIQLHRDPTGVIWSWGGYSLEQWKNGKFVKIASSPDGVANAFGSWQVVGDRFGTLWAFSHGRGFLSLEHGRWRVWATPPEVAKQHVANMYAESTGRIWVATYEGSIITMDKGAIVAYSVKTETHLGDVRAFGEHTSEEIWAGGAGGLALIDHSHFRAIRPAGVDSLGDVTGIVDAGSYGLWLNTADGVIRVSSAEVDRAVRDPSYRFQWERFDSSDGLPGHSEAIYPYPKAVEGTDGRIWFTATKGVAWIDPKKIPRNALPPPVSITSVSANGSDFVQLAGLRLPANADTVQINYSALSLSVPERVRFRFKLDGIDKDWQDVGTRRQAFYNNVGPGLHTFRVIASNNDGVWNETGAILEFSILPAYYQTTWFRALVLTAFATLLWAAHRYRLRQVAYEFEARLQERVNERTRIARDLHDTLLQSFHGLLFRFQAATNRLPDSDVKKQFESAIGQAARAITEGRDAVQNLRASAVVTNDLGEAIGTLGKELAAAQVSDANAPPAVVEVSVEGTPRDLHPILRDDIYRIAGEALRNAFRHSRAHYIEVEIRYDDTRLQVRVRDDGKGIDQKMLDEPREGHFGLPGMRERAGLIGARLDVWSNPGLGAEVELTVPAAAAYATPRARGRSWLFAGRTGRTS
jgi:signal transduction histidine kinase/ligand-binding sensor domain-containing protein